MRILVLGVTGMLGNAVYRFFHESSHETWGTLRNASALCFFTEPMRKRLLTNVDVLNQDDLITVFEKIRPEVVINCVGLIKQLSCANNPLTVLPINAMLPHRLASLTALSKSRLIHISTDCVFSGSKGGYTEDDKSDAEDLYGKSKFLGEIINVSHVVTLRTSIIGHELQSRYALLDWFLSQTGVVTGYTKAIYSGLTADELARVIHDYVLPNHDLSGLYHVATQPINKYDLLSLIAQVYDKKIRIEPCDKVAIDRSLCSQRFTQKTGYIAPAWPHLIKQMRSLHVY